MVDRDFDAGTSPCVRSLRIHETGHALGYEHVTLRTSFMSPTAVNEPLEFERDATRLACQRPVGNRTPDTDPGGCSTNSQGRSLPLVWGPITP